MVILIFNQEGFKFDDCIRNEVKSGHVEVSKLFDLFTSFRGEFRSVQNTAISAQNTAHFKTTDNMHLREVSGSVHQSCDEIVGFDRSKA